MEIKWHYDENPPEPEEGCERAYLAALYAENWGVRFIMKAWYDGAGLWSHDFDPIITVDIYAWAKWPATPPRKEAT